jgi:hypothetical protein
MGFRWKATRGTTARGFGATRVDLRSLAAPPIARHAAEVPATAAASLIACFGP